MILNYVGYAVLAWIFWHLFKIILGLAKRADKMRSLQSKMGELNVRKMMGEE